MTNESNEARKCQVKLDGNWLMIFYSGKIETIINFSHISCINRDFLNKDVVVLSIISGLSPSDPMRFEIDLSLEDFLSDIGYKNHDKK